MFESILDFEQEELMIELALHATATAFAFDGEDLRKRFDSRSAEPETFANRFRQTALQSNQLLQLVRHRRRNTFVHDRLL